MAAGWIAGWVGSMEATSAAGQVGESRDGVGSSGGSMAAGWIAGWVGSMEATSAARQRHQSVSVVTVLTFSEFE